MRDESGTSLVELMVASGIVLSTLLVLTTVVTAGLSMTAIARQRQSGTSIASQTIEQVRSLPFDRLTRGLDTADLAAGTDPEITTTGCGGSYCFEGERVVHASNPPDDPLVPHVRTLTAGPTAYTVSAIVTNYGNDPASRTYRVTVTVTWTAQRGDGGRTRAQTIVNSPTGCLSTAVHPFSGPCQASFSASATREAGSVTITGDLDTIALQQAILQTANQTSDMRVEQIAAVQGTAQQAAVRLQLTGQNEESRGGTQVASAADNDPSGGTNLHSAATLAYGASGTVSHSSASDTITVSRTAGDEGSTTSTTSADVPSRPCLSAEDDRLPCGESDSRQTSTLTATVRLQPGGTDLGTTTLASVGTEPAASDATTDQNAAPSATACTATSGDGCVRAAVTRSAPVYSLGALPPELEAPSGWDGYAARISGLTDGADAEAGVGAARPTAEVTAGTLSYFQDGSYVDLDITTLTSTVTIPAITVSAGSVTVSIAGTISPGSVTADDPAGCPSTCTRASAVATSSPPTVTLVYTIAADGSTQSLTVVADPGDLRSKVTYAAAQTS